METKELGRCKHCGESPKIKIEVIDEEGENKERWFISVNCSCTPSCAMYSGGLFGCIRTAHVFWNDKVEEKFN